MKTIHVTYSCGKGRYTTDDVSYMQAFAENADGQTVELYAEVSEPIWVWPELTEVFIAAEEDYPNLKAEIIRQAQQAGIDPELLDFR